MKTQPTSRFVKLHCPKCKNSQIAFEKTTTKISCHMCQEPLASPTGGKLDAMHSGHEILD
jgi:ribosomal protein S27E